MGWIERSSMRCAVLLAAIASSACSGDDVAGGDAGTVGSGAPTGSTTGAVASTSSAEAPSGSESPADAGSTSPVTTGDSSDGGSTGAGTSERSRCDMALSQRECEGIRLASAPEFQSPTCRWLDVYGVEVSPSCTLIESSPRCVLFFGNLLGCGGPGCEFPNDGELYVREVDGTAELLIYPDDELCGPLPAAPADQSQWESCSKSSTAACECFCGLL